VRALASQLTDAAQFRAGDAVHRAHQRLRESIAFMHRDRSMQCDIAAACRLVRDRAFAP